MIGVQLDRTASDETVLALAAFSSDQIVVQDLRESNRQDRGTYYAARIVLYGFLAIIGGISLLNIVNSISMSVSARMKQYGILRAIGMDDAQLKRMVSAEAGTYAVSGLVVGIALGLVLNRMLYTRLITHYFGAAWQVPWGCLAVIVVVVRRRWCWQYITRSGESSCSPLLQPSVNYKPEQQMPTSLWRKP